MSNEPNNEQKPSVDEIVDKAFEGLEQPTESSPSPVQPAVPVESVTDTPKTEAPVVPAAKEEDDKGFASHPSWQKREAKLKEAQGKLAELLDDPVVLKRHLERQGYSRSEVAQVMRERGMRMESETTPSPMPQDQKDALVLAVCQKKGWDYNNLNSDQKDYLRDLISTNEEVFNIKAEKLLSERLAPIEERFKSMEANERTQTQMSQAESIASKYKFDFQKDILPSIEAKLDELDKVDPLRKIPFDVVSYTKDMVLQLVEERGFQQARQEARTDLKKGATPLKPGALQPASAKVAKGKSVSETVDSYFDAHGIRG